MLCVNCMINLYPIYVHYLEMSTSESLAVFSKRFSKGTFSLSFPYPRAYNVRTVNNFNVLENNFFKEITKAYSKERKKKTEFDDRIGKSEWPRFPTYCYGVT